MKQSDKVKEAFLEAYDANADALFNHCFYRVSDRETALDLTQEAFAKTWEYLAKGKTVGNLRPFLFKVLNNLIIDHYRKHKSDSLEAMREEGFDIASADAEKIVISAEGSRALRALEVLDGKYREVVIMRFLDELSPREIAQIIGETENAVSVRINRSLKKLKEILKT